MFIVEENDWYSMFLKAHLYIVEMSQYIDEKNIETKLDSNYSTKEDR